MHSCQFNKDTCTVNCKKYPMCSFYAIQSQLSVIQEQINFLYNITKDIMTSDVETGNKITELREDLVNYTCELLTLINDSDTNKGVNSEKESK